MYEIKEGLTFKEAWELCAANKGAALVRPGWDWYSSLELEDERLTPEDAMATDYQVRIPVREYTAAEALELPNGTHIENVNAPKCRFVVFNSRHGASLCWAEHYKAMGVTDFNLKGPYRVVEDPKP